MDEEEDPFGGRGRGRGMGMGLSMEDASPKRFFMVRVDENILVSSSRSQMQRMLDVLEGEDVDGGLGELDSWKGVNGFLGDSGFRMVLLTNHLGEMMESMGQPFLVNMAKPMVVAMFGRIDAIGFNMESAEAPALATFTKLSILDPNLATGIIGKSIADASALDWVKNWSSVGFVKIIDGNGDGILQINEFFMKGDVVVLATPEIAGLPYVISGLVAAGGLAAAMSTADGLLLAIANALSHDLYYKIIDPKADTARRLIVARILLLFIGAAGAVVASLKLTGILGAVAWAFDFACSGLFFPLVLGVWWKRANRAGAVAGMIGGFGAGAWYLYMVQFGGMTPWLGLDGLRFGMIGMPVSLALMVIVSLMTEEPDEETQKMVDAIRIPKGDTVTNA